MQHYFQFWSPFRTNFIWSFLTFIFTILFNVFFLHYPKICFHTFRSIMLRQLSFQFMIADYLESSSCITGEVSWWHFKTDRFSELVERVLWEQWIYLLLVWKLTLLSVENALPGQPAQGTAGRVQPGAGYLT